MNAFILWEDDNFRVDTPKNPHIPYSEGAHMVIAPKQDVRSAWEDIELAKATFGLAAQVCKIMEDLEFAPWFNMQANGNWGFLPDRTPFFHIHVYGRNKTARWAKPVILPDAPNTYQHEPMPETDRDRLATALRDRL